jgi:hypothetical protein
MAYIILLVHPGSDATRIAANATTDKQAIDEARRICASGYRGNLRIGSSGTVCNVELSDGRTYACRNIHGRAMGSYFNAL